MAVEVTNCKRCGRLFQQITMKRICPDCVKALEEKFMDVREYIREIPNASVMEVSREKDVSVDQIKQWIREERLAFTTAEGSDINCVHCGVPIKTGKYCEHCKEQLSHTLNALYEGDPKKESKEKDSGPRMRYLGKE